MRGMPFSSPMVLALLNTQVGTYPGMPTMIDKPHKWVTRRIPKQQQNRQKITLERGPFYMVGQIYVVNEGLCRVGEHAHYQADNTKVRVPIEPLYWHWQRDTLPGLFMPNVAGRMWVEVMGARLEPLHAMTGMECVYEGLMVDFEELDKVHGEGNWGVAEEKKAYLEKFATLLDSLNEPGTWASNPLVWRYELKRVPCPEE